MSSPDEIEEVRKKLDRARAERDAWSGRNRHNFEMATLLVAALERQLAKLLDDDAH